MLLKSLTKYELSQEIRPVFDTFYEQLSSNQQKFVSYQDVIDNSYDMIHTGRGSDFNFIPMSTSELILHPSISAKTDVDLIPCLEAVGVVVTDAIGMVFQLLGIPESASRAASRAILKELGEDVLRGIQATIHDFRNVTTLLEKAKLMWTILSETYTALGISAFVGALKDSMSWYQWIITGVVAIAQLTIWFASDGAAFIAEILLAAAYLVQLFVDAYHAVEICYGLHPTESDPNDMLQEQTK